MIKLITQQEVVDGVPKRWEKVYKLNGTNQQKGITLSLNSLSKPINKDEVNSIIGNTSWTRLSCDICSQETNAIVCIESDSFDGYEGANAYVCKECISKMSNLIK